MKPILSARKRSSSVGDMVATSTPSIRSSPSVGRSRQPMRLTRVLLPEPEGPVMATHSPATMEKEAWSRARTTPAWPTYSRVTPCRAMTAQSGRVSRSIGLSVTRFIFSFPFQQRCGLQSAKDADGEEGCHRRDQHVQEQDQRKNSNARLRCGVEVDLADDPCGCRSYDEAYRYTC